MAATIDLNSDLGEGVGDDAALVPLITSANVACGFHAGDPTTMTKTVHAAVEHGVRIGAQVSYADREGFGRRPMDVPSEQLTADVLYQLGALAAICRAAGGALSYVKPHGALYNRILDDNAQAEAVIVAIEQYDATLPLLTLPGSVAARVGAAAGLRVVHEGFADRAYDDRGRLVPRTQPGAVIVDAEIASWRALDLARSGVQSICVHGDTTGAVAIARSVRRALEDADFEVAAFA